MVLDAQQPRFGYQRDWFWRGWKIRYLYLPAVQQVLDHRPLILLHGFGASAEHWRQNLTVLSQHQSVYALDLLGFGASEKAAAPYTPGFWADCVYEFWQTFVRQSAVLVGNSLGSVVSMVAASHYPEMVDGLIFLNLPDASVLSPHNQQANQLARRLQACFKPVQVLLLGLITLPWVITPILAVARSPRLLWGSLTFAYANDQYVDAELYEIVRDPAYDRQAAQALRFMTRSMPNMPDRQRARQILPRLKVPMLLIWGQQDRIVPPQLAPRCASLNPRIQLVELDHAGHCPQDECADRVNSLILAWLQQAFDLSERVDPQPAAQ